MGLYIRGRRYYFKKQIDGQVYRKSLSLKKGQERLLSARLEQVEEGILAKHFNIPSDSSDRISFNEYCEIYLRSKKDIKSIDRITQRLEIIKVRWKDPKLSSISKRHIKELEQYLFKRKLKSTTVNRYFEILRALFNMAIEDGYLKDNPARFYVPFLEDSTRRSLSQNEVRKILDAAKQISERPASPFQRHILDLIKLALYTGMRLSEILNLKRSYIREGIIYYPLSMTKIKKRMASKDQKYKLVVLNSGAKKVMRRQPKRSSDYVFPVRRDPNIVYWTVQRIREITGIHDFTFHQLRHTVSTYLSSELSLATAKTVLGHRDLKTTLRYTHPDLSEQRKAVSKMDTWISKISRGSAKGPKTPLHFSGYKKRHKKGHRGTLKFQG